MSLPPLTPSGSVSVVGFTLYSRTGSGGTSAQVADQIESSSINGVNRATPFPAPAASFSGNPMGGTSQPATIVQPTIACNYIIRVL